MNNQEILKQARIILRDQVNEESALTAPSLVGEYCQLQLATEEREHFAVLLLNNQHKLIDFKILFSGTIDGASVYPREVLKAVLLSNAAAVIFTHNHPSGAIAPSQADRQLTTRLTEALALIDVRVLDHIVVGCEGYYSFAQSGDL